MNILKFPNPFLTTATYEVTVFGEELKVLLDSMYETMKANNGIGLAANQVGLLHRMFVMDAPEGRVNVVNPVVISKSIRPANRKEGCLSAPGEFVVVPSRMEWVQIHHKDEKGNLIGRVFSGIHAVCFQHELDHLDGKTFLSNKSIPRRERKLLGKKWGVK